MLKVVTCRIVWWYKKISTDGMLPALTRYQGFCIEVLQFLASFGNNLPKPFRWWPVECTCCMFIRFSSWVWFSAPHGDCIFVCVLWVLCTHLHDICACRYGWGWMVSLTRSLSHTLVATLLQALFYGTSLGGWARTFSLSLSYLCLPSHTDALLLRYIGNHKRKYNLHNRDCIYVHVRCV
jgi:hypothetical protein